MVLRDPVLLAEDLLEARSAHKVALLAEQRGVVRSEEHTSELQSPA